MLLHLPIHVLTYAFTMITQEAETQVNKRRSSAGIRAGSISGGGSGNTGGGTGGTGSYFSLLRVFVNKYWYVTIER